MPRNAKTVTRAENILNFLFHFQRSNNAHYLRLIRIPQNNKPATLKPRRHSDQDPDSYQSSLYSLLSLWTCYEEIWGQVSLTIGLKKWKKKKRKSHYPKVLSMVLGTRLQGYGVTSRASFPPLDRRISYFWSPDFWFRQSENTCHQFLGSDSWNSENGLAAKLPDYKAYTGVCKVYKSCM